LAVGGMTVHSSFVPRHDEELEITLLPPQADGHKPKPMIVRARVRRCHEVEQGKCYEIGLEIMQIVS
jgi:hypothetical protein